jgi:hypothetical protein
MVTGEEIFVSVTKERISVSWKLLDECKCGPT